MGMNKNEAEAKALADKRARNARDAAIKVKEEYAAKRAALAANSANKNNSPAPKGENFYEAVKHNYSRSIRSAKKHDGNGKSFKF